MKKCIYCDSSLEEGIQYCPNCGAACQTSEGSAAEKKEEKAEEKAKKAGKTTEEYKDIFDQKQRSFTNGKVELPAPKKKSFLLKLVTAFLVYFFPFIGIFVVIFKKPFEKVGTIVSLVWCILFFIAFAFSIKSIYYTPDVYIKEYDSVIPMGRTVKLKYSFTEKYITEDELQWSSSDEEVLVVKDGKATGIAPGEAVIKLWAEDKAEDDCLVTVAYIPPTSLMFQSIENNSLYLNSPLELNAEKLLITVPEKASLNTLTWSSSDESIAVIEDGYLKALKPGTVDLTVETAEGVTAVRTYQVYDVAPESVSLNPGEIEMKVGETYQLNPILSPPDAEPSLTYSGRDGVSVDENGLITAQTQGEAVVQVETTNGLAAKCSVHVKAV